MIDHKAEYSRPRMSGKEGFLLYKCDGRNYSQLARHATSFRMLSDAKETGPVELNWTTMYVDD